MHSVDDMRRAMQGKRVITWWEGVLFCLAAGLGLLYIWIVAAIMLFVPQNKGE